MLEGRPPQTPPFQTISQEIALFESLRSPEELRDLAAARGIAAPLPPAARPMPPVEDAAAAMGVPVAALTQDIVPNHYRAIEPAVAVFLANFVGLGIGPTLLGVSIDIA